MRQIVPLLKPLVVLSLISLITFVLVTGAPILQPLALAIFLALILQMPVNAAEIRGVPRPAAVVAVILFILAAGWAIYQFALVPAQQLLGDVPRLQTDVSDKLHELRQSFRNAEDATESLKQAAADVTAMVGDEAVPQVVVREPSFMTRAALSFVEIASIFALTVVFVSFMLVARNPFLILATVPFAGFTSKRHAAETWRNAESRIARYFLATALINAALGLVVGLALWAYDMPAPAFWGTAAALLNFMPLVGLLVGATALFLVSIVTYDTIFLALLPPFTYLAINLVEANFVTPAIIGNHMKIAPIAVVLALIFWGWVWGVIGLLIAVPLLVLAKAVSDESKQLNTVHRLLSRRN